jgi:F-type H+-transporting ATPase subunit b
MSRLTLLAGSLVQAEEPLPNDGVGTVSLHPIWAPLKEVIIGGLATLVVFALLYKFAWPAIKKAMNDRTAGIQSDLDASAEARAKAEQDAAEIRQALGDIDAERTRLFAEADAQAAALLEDGRSRLDAEIAELRERAEVEIANTASRGTDELRVEIARYSSTAIEDVVRSTIDDAAHQDLIEGFISRVGAGQGATS